MPEMLLHRAEVPVAAAEQLHEIQRKRAVDLTQILRQREAQPELRGDLVATIRQDLKRQLSCPAQLPVVLGQLGRNRHQGAPSLASAGRIACRATSSTLQ